MPEHASGGLTRIIPNGMVYAMTLRQYLALTGMTQQQFASQIGASQSAISRYVVGLRVPRLKHLLRIIEATDGAVTPTDFVSANVNHEIPKRQHA